MNLTEPVKTCSQCLTSKPRSAFSKQTRNKDGLRPECRECSSLRRQRAIASPEGRLRFREYQRKWRQANREREIERSRSKTPEKRAFYNDRRVVNREKAKANEAVRNALRRGEMIKPSECERCHEYKRLHAHHDDYRKPLDIMWLCQRCHGLRHQELNDKEIAA